MSRDDLNDIPSFAANRDEAVSSAPRGAIPARAGRTEAVMGLTARLVLTIALAAAGIACGWAWQLQTLLDTSQAEQKATQARVADLEALLSDTDETVNKSAAAMGAQLRLLDTEVRKLWDARKISNSKFTKLEKIVSHKKSRSPGSIPRRVHRANSWSPCKPTWRRSLRWREIWSALLQVPSVHRPTWSGLLTG